MKNRVDSRDRYYLLKQLLLIIVFGLVYVNAHAVMITVTTTSDEVDENIEDGICKIASTGECSLRAAVQQANYLGGMDTIEIPAGTYFLSGPSKEDAALSGDLDILDDVKIVGAEHALVIIDGQNNDRIFDVNEVRYFELENVTLLNGNAVNGNGGAIQINNLKQNTQFVNESKITKVTLRKNQAAAARGGAIYQGLGTHLSLDSVQLVENTSTLGGGIYSADGNLNIQNSLIENNTASSLGAGIHSQNYLNIQSSQIKNNQASSGGGIYARGVIYVANSIVSGNQALGESGNTGLGGGILIRAPLDVSLVGSEISSNTAVVQGGGLSIENRLNKARIVLTELQISNNHAELSGGGIEAQNLTLLNQSVVKGNSAGFRGAGIYLSNSVGIVSDIHQSVFDANKVRNPGLRSSRNAFGGAAYLIGNVSFVNTIISNNSVQAAIGGKALGGGLFLLGTSSNQVSFSHSTLAFNDATYGANLNSRYLRGQTDLSNSIVSDAKNGENCFGPMTSLGGNLDSDGSCLLSMASDLSNVNPLLDVVDVDLTSQIIGLQSSSPAIDSAENSNCVALDQQMRQRNDGLCDRGALENAASINDYGTVKLVSTLYSVAETGATIALELERFGSSIGEVSIDYRVDHVDTNSSDIDLDAARGRVMWADGELGAKSIQIDFNDDQKFEANERFQLIIMNPVGGVRTDMQNSALVSILDDDAIQDSTISLSARSLSVKEGDIRRVINIERAAVFPYLDVSAELVISSATASEGQDFNLSTKALDFAAGVTRVSVLLDIQDDALYEGDESITLQLRNPSIGARLDSSNNQMSIDLADNETSPATGIFEFSSAKLSLYESQGDYLLPVNRSSGVQGAVLLDYVIVAGNASADIDYTANSGQLFFAGGVDTQTISLSIIEDEMLEGDENFFVQLKNPQGGGSLGVNRSLEIVIVDNEQRLPQPGSVAFLQAGAAANEDAGTITIDVVRSDGRDGAVSVDYFVTGGTASAGDDYNFTRGTLEFADQETAKTISVSIVDDALVEMPETIVISLRDPLGGATLGAPNDVVITVIDNDVDQPPADDIIQFALSAVAEQESVWDLLIEVRRSAGSSTQASVDYSVTGGTAEFFNDYIVTEGTITFTPGQLSQFIPVSFIDDFDQEPDETIILTLGNLVGDTAQLGDKRTVTITIVDNDSADGPPLF
ncbi:MAG: CSLREA domain-containing protein [Gammaproteobacteria bacterium]|nr:CSLREA domain-containing protein [Gammaproteobacteria bacterium]